MNKLFKLTSIHSTFFLAWFKLFLDKRNLNKALSKTHTVKVKGAIPDYNPMHFLSI